MDGRKWVGYVRVIRQMAGEAADGLNVRVVETPHAGVVEVLQQLVDTARLLEQVSGEALKALGLLEIPKPRTTEDAALKSIVGTPLHEILAKQRVKGVQPLLVHRDERVLRHEPVQNPFCPVVSNGRDRASARKRLERCHPDENLAIGLGEGLHEILREEPLDVSVLRYRAAGTDALGNQVDGGYPPA